MRIVLVEPNKAARPVEIEDNLQDMQALVGGPIQALYPWEDPVDIIAGTFFICGIQGENFSGLTEQQIQKYQQMFRSPEKFVNTPGGLLCIRMNPVITPERKAKAKRAPDQER